MKALTISLRSDCNLQCPTCPIPPKWRVSQEEAKNRNDINLIKDDELINWLKHFDPKEWFIEFTGGEPSLHPTLDSLLEKLSALGYKGVVKTNGIIPIKKTNFIRAAAWHKDQPMPLYHIRDVLLIINNPDDCWEEKIKYCKKNDIPYEIIEFDRKCEGLEHAKVNDSTWTETHGFTECCHINSSGQVTECACTPVIPEQGMYYWKRTRENPCKGCKNLVDIWRFVDKK